MDHTVCYSAYHFSSLPASNRWVKVHVCASILHLIILSSWISNSAFQFPEYRTVSGVAGPLVILDKVKVELPLFFFCFQWGSLQAMYRIHDFYLRVVSGTQISGDCQYSAGGWNYSAWTSPRSWWGEGCGAGLYFCCSSVIGVWFFFLTSS